MEVTKTITTMFIVPSLKIDRLKLKENGFMNGYEQDSSQDGHTYQDSVYLLFKPDDFHKFRVFLEEEVDRTPAVIDDYDYEGGYVVIVYKLDDRFKNDYKLIYKGQYSKTSKEFQLLFPKTIKIIKYGLHKDEISLQHRIFNKSPELRKFWEEKLGVEFDEEMEIWDGYSKEREILNINKIKQNV